MLFSLLLWDLSCCCCCKFFTLLLILWEDIACFCCCGRMLHVFSCWKKLHRVVFVVRKSCIKWLLLLLSKVACFCGEILHAMAIKIMHATVLATVNYSASRLSR